MHLCDKLLRVGCIVGTAMFGYGVWDNKYGPYDGEAPALQTLFDLVYHGRYTICPGLALLAVCLSVYFYRRHSERFLTIKGRL
jgi:hypothetical protein